MGNHNSGRRPQPTALKILRGNPSKTRLNALEPIPPGLPVVAPETLSPGARLVWDRLAPICLAMRTLTAADVDTFASLCELQSTMHQAAAWKSAEGFAVLVASVDAMGAPVLRPHPALKIERDTAMSLRSYYSYFGLEPSARARLQVPKLAEEPAASKWAEVLK